MCTAIKAVLELFSKGYTGKWGVSIAATMLLVRKWQLHYIVIIIHKTAD